MLLTTYTALLLSLEVYTTIASPVPVASPQQLQPSFTTGPVLPDGFADPCIVQTPNGTWWAFASNNTGQNVPIALSQDFQTWELQNGFDALPDPGAWTAKPSLVWAPDVAQLANGSFVMYYAAASSSNTSQHCIGVATSPDIMGPYVAHNEPWACPSDQGGAIDPSFFSDPAAPPDKPAYYVLYKVDGNTLVGGGPCGNQPPSKREQQKQQQSQAQASTPIMLQPVSATDGLTPLGSAIPILDRDASDGPLVEAPSLVAVKSGGEGGGLGGWVYVLFFSSNCYSTVYYDVSYAVSTSGVSGGAKLPGQASVGIMGPGFAQAGKEGGEGGYVKAEQPLLASGKEGLSAPGGLDISPDAQHVVFHADSEPGQATVRQMHAGVVSISGEGTVSIS